MLSPARVTRSGRRIASLLAISALFGVASSANAAISTNATGVYDEQTIALNAVDVAASGTASGNLVQVTLANFKASITTAFAAGMGGVINFDDASDTNSDASMLVSYATGSKTLTVSGAAYQIQAAAINVAPISGAKYLRNGSATGIQSFAFSSPLTSVGATVLARNADRTITATVTYDDNSTGILSGVSVPTNSSSGDTSTPDTFFGFDAPAGRTIKSIQFSAGANNFFVLDDIGFVVAVPEPTTLSLAGLAAVGMLARRRRK